MSTTGMICQPEIYGPTLKERALAAYEEMLRIQTTSKEQEDTRLLEVKANYGRRELEVLGITDYTLDVLSKNVRITADGLVFTVLGPYANHSYVSPRLVLLRPCPKCGCDTFSAALRFISDLGAALRDEQPFHHDCPARVVAVSTPEPRTVGDDLLTALANFIASRGEEE